MWTPVVCPSHSTAALSVNLEAQEEPSLPQGAQLEAGHRLPWGRARTAAGAPRCHPEFKLALASGSFLGAAYVPQPVGRRLRQFIRVLGTLHAPGGAVCHQTDSDGDSRVETKR